MSRHLPATRNDGYVYHDRVMNDAAGLSVLDYYASRYPRWPRGEWRGRIERGLVRRNDAPIGVDASLVTGDRLQYRRAPWVEPAVPIEVDVVYDDGDLLALSKPAGLPVVPDAHHIRHTLLAWARGHIGPSVAPLHRLDRGTSGLVLFARRRSTRGALSALWPTGGVEKTYDAVCAGRVPRGPTVLDFPIGRRPDPELGHLHVATAGGKWSRSIVHGSRLTGADSRVGITLITGRPHQARIHLARWGHPLRGDTVYGRRTSGARLGDGGFHLHARRLAFPHPRTGERLTIEAGAPEWDL